MQQLRIFKGLCVPLHAFIHVYVVEYNLWFLKHSLHNKGPKDNLYFAENCVKKKCGLDIHGVVIFFNSLSDIFIPNFSN
jgi:hypothetical protein